jgi:hypothetical protein
MESWKSESMCSNPRDLKTAQVEYAYYSGLFMVWNVEFDAGTKKRRYRNHQKSPFHFHITEALHRIHPEA